MNNKKIRKALKETGVKYWELARIMGISDATLCRRLRDEIPAEEQDKIVKLIREHGGDGTQHGVPSRRKKPLMRRPAHTVR